ncbi:MAG: glycosyltransferase family 2 protein [Planctomycetota bacterium]|nr:MAG: glycosyltransferase family 2 protein [Planctomycetota bacterium]
MRFLVAIPVFNEASNLQAVLRQVRRYVSEILVVNDGSTDKTPQLLSRETGIFQIHHKVNRGYGQSLISAFNFAVAGAFDWLITMDCDEQHEPAQIPDFIDAATLNNADIISGSRYLAAMEGNSLPPPDRRTINRRITGVLNDLLGLRITDAFCGFKAYRVSVLTRLHLTVPGYGMPMQLWVQAADQSLRIREIPVRLIYKHSNRSFGGILDDPEARLNYYHEILARELQVMSKSLERIEFSDLSQEVLADVVSNR